MCARMFERGCKGIKYLLINHKVGEFKDYLDIYSNLAVGSNGAVNNINHEHDEVSIDQSPGEGR